MIVYLNMYPVLHIACGISYGACHLVELVVVARSWNGHECHNMYIIIILCVLLLHIVYAMIVYLSMYPVLHIVRGISYGACHPVELVGVARSWNGHACHGVFVLLFVCVYYYCVICACLLCIQLCIMSRMHTCEYMCR